MTLLEEAKQLSNNIKNAVIATEDPIINIELNKARSLMFQVNRSLTKVILCEKLNRKVDEVS